MNRAKVVEESLRMWGLTLLVALSMEGVPEAEAAADKREARPTTSKEILAKASKRALGGERERELCTLQGGHASMRKT